MQSTPSISSYYNTNATAEHTRLPSHPLEFHLTSRVIQSLLPTTTSSSSPSSSSSSLPPPQQHIADIGGGTGRYALLLARQGHAVYFSDLAAASVEICRQAAEAEGLKLGCCVQADAAAIQEAGEVFRVGFFDVVLLLGPLYHLIEGEARRRCLEDCVEMLKPGGLVVAAMINKVGHLRDLVQRDPGRLGREWAFYERYLRDGVYDRRTDGSVSWHTDPAEARKLVESVPGLVVERMVAAEGVLGGLSDRLKELGEEELERWVQVNEELSETAGALQGADHVLVVARKMKGEEGASSSGTGNP